MALNVFFDSPKPNNDFFFFKARTLNIWETENSIFYHFAWKIIIKVAEFLFLPDLLARIAFYLPRASRESLLLNPKLISLQKYLHNLLL